MYTKITMMRKCWIFLTFGLFATIASAQVFEVSVNGGTSRMGDAALQENPTDYILGNGFRLDIRMTLNTWRFMGHEVGYGYSHSSITSQGQSIGFSIHEGYYNFLVYATPEGSRVRPFATGGVHFASFVPPGGSVYYGITKFGVNYGAGLKFRLSGPFGARIDYRVYNTGKPDFGITQLAPSGRLNQSVFTVGVSYNM